MCRCKNINMFWLLLVSFFVYSAPADASLQVIGTATYGGSSYNLIYVDSSPFGSIVYLDYSMNSANWSSQVAWASSLNNAGVMTYNLNTGYSMNWSGGWRLSSMVDGPVVNGSDGSTTSGYNITTSELGYLFYTELRNKGALDVNGNAQVGFGLTNVGPFANLQSSMYWSGTDSSQYQSSAWYISTYFGAQGVNGEAGPLLALAVRPGHLVVNHPPTISGTPISGITSGTYYSFTPNATDSDANALTFSIVNKPSWTSFNTSTGMLSGTPPSAGTFSNIQISVSDGNGGIASLPAFSITTTSSGGSSGTGGGTGGGGTGTAVPVMEGWWLLPGVLAGVGVFARRKKE